MSKTRAGTNVIFHFGKLRQSVERYVTVLLVVTLHLFVIWQLSSRFFMLNRPHSTRGHETVVYLMPPPPRAKPDTRHVPVPEDRQAPAIRPQPAVTAPTHAVKPDLPATPQPILPTINEPEAHAEGGITQHSLDSVASVLKALRKEGALPAVENAEVKPSRFERAIASAARPRETTMQTFQSNDGHMVTRVSGPRGTYCVEAALDSDADGIDHMQHGVGTKIVHCPF